GGKRGRQAIHHRGGVDPGARLRMANAGALAARPSEIGVRPSRRAGRELPAYLFLLPWLLGFFFLTLGPTLASLYLSFTSYDLVRSPRWTGLANYARMFGDDVAFTASLKVPFTYVALAVPLKLAFALAIALALNKGVRGLPIYRAIFYLPSLLGASVAIAVLWRIIFAGDGLFNRLLALF